MSDDHIRCPLSWLGKSPSRVTYSPGSSRITHWIGRLSENRQLGTSLRPCGWLDDPSKSNVHLWTHQRCWGKRSWVGAVLIFRFKSTCKRFLERPQKNEARVYRCIWSSATIHDRCRTWHDRLCFCTPSSWSVQLVGFNHEPTTGWCMQHLQLAPGCWSWLQLHPSTINYTISPIPAVVHWIWAVDRKSVV